jgi:hypothetical protein
MHKKGYVKVLTSKGEFSGFVNIHFTDDTILFLESRSRYIKALK